MRFVDTLYLYIYLPMISKSVDLGTDWNTVKYSTYI